MSLFKNFNTSKFKSKKPPGDRSITTYSEIQQIKNIKVDKKFVEEKDDIFNVFKKVANQHNIPYPAEMVNKLLDDSAIVIMRLKNYFNRPRPQELAKEFNIDLKAVELKSAKTPSYPSGHSAQGVLIGKFLADEYPIAADKFLKESKNISFSRNMAKVHYRSDSEFGERLGDALYDNFKNEL